MKKHSILHKFFSAGAAALMLTVLAGALPQDAAAKAGAMSGQASGSVMNAAGLFSALGGSTAYAQSGASEGTGAAPAAAQAGTEAAAQTAVPQTPSERVIWESCVIEGSDVVIKGQLTGGITPADTLMGQDAHIYLLELDPYDDDVTDNRYTEACDKALGAVQFRLPLNNGTPQSRLYKKFIACIWNGTKYVPVSEPIYITNPEAVAKHTDPYKESITKKGLLIELEQISDAFDLGVSHVIVNIPYNALFGTGIDYVYEGETYHFSREIVEAYDKTISTFSGKSMLVTAVLLNGWNDNTPDLYYPGTTKTSAANYYHFNSRTEAGYKDIKAVASFLADRYCGTNANYGRVQNWIIGNEVNNQLWNYIGPMPLEDYVNEFERTFRIFYTAIKSTWSEARVFFSTDFNWMNEANGTTKYNAKEFIDLFAALTSQRGNIDWNLAYHPYSVPMTEPEFWDDFSTGLLNWEETSPIVNFANLQVLTDYFQRPELRDRYGNLRHIILSEQGFTSQSLTRGECEELQAAAFAYAYYLVDSNPQIDAFILSRQVDAPSEVATSCAFGLWTTDAAADVNIVPKDRKYIWQVFKDIDKKNTTLESSEFAKEILGIERWSDVIPNFKWTRFEK